MAGPLELPGRARQALAQASEVRLPTWLLGLAAALLTWKGEFGPPGTGIDLGWHTGLAIAAHEGLQFGTEVIFTYGPLGFLSLPGVWYDDLAILAFCYGAILYIALSIGLVWALRRSLPTGAAFVGALLTLALLPRIERPVALAAILALGILQRERPPVGLNVFVVATASLAAIETLNKISLGPLVFALGLIALVGARARWWQVGAFVSIYLGEALALWAIAGQELSHLDDFVRNSVEIVRGYNEAMAGSAESSWHTLAAVAPLAAIAASAAGHYRDRLARGAAVLLVAVATLALFKEGMVRIDDDHVALYVSTACALWLAIPWAATQRAALIGGAAALGAIALHVVTPLSAELDPVGNVKKAGEQVRTLLSPGRRADLADLGREGMKQVYGIDRGTLAALRGHTVSIDPWEIGVVWAYDLEWAPLPVFQNYSAYTERLDELNSDEIASPSGPQRILRENLALPAPPGATRNVDGRYPAWDPPGQVRATLCHFVPIHTTDRWQVLARRPDRCGEARPAGSVESSFGETVRVPAPGPREVVFVRIDGAGIEGWERLRALLLRPKLRFLVVDGSTPYRLVPGTARDGLMLRASDGVAGSGPFAQVPQANSITLTGASGELRFDFFRLPVDPAPPSS